LNEITSVLYSMSQKMRELQIKTIYKI
jgi:hypothetical protein